MTTLFLAVPGTQETRELSLESVRDGVASGEIQLDNLAWSTQGKQWVPLSQHPDFAPVVPASVPVPAPVVPMRVVPRKVETPGKAAGVPVPDKKGRHAKTVYSKPIEEARESPFFKILFLILCCILAGIIAINYYLVDKPFRVNLAKTAFSGVQAHAHLGAFVQPTILLIHVVPNHTITSENFCDLLIAVSKSAPREVLAGTRLRTISLTSEWRAQYVMTAEAWSGLPDLSADSLQEKQQFVLDHLKSISGQPLVVPHPNRTEAQQRSEQEQAWHDLVARFHGS